MKNLCFLPQRVTGGETIWISADNTLQSAKDIIITNYLPTEYTLKYNFSSTPAVPLAVDATANGDNTGWTLEVSTAQTLAWDPGKVIFTGEVTNSTTERVTVVDSGNIQVDASPVRVSSWVAVLAKVDAAIAEFAATPQSSFSVDGLSVTYRSMDDLERLRNYANYRLQLDTATRPKRIIHARFPVR